MPDAGFDTTSAGPAPARVAARGLDGADLEDTVYDGPVYSDDDADYYDDVEYETDEEEPAPRTPLTPTTKMLLLVSAAIAVVLAVILALVFGFVLPQHRAQAAYNASLSTFRTAQASLASTTQTAQTMLTQVTTDQVADPGVLDALKAQLTSASTQASTPVKAAADVSALAAQTADLDSRTSQLKAANTKLQAAMTAVTASQIANCVTQLSTALPAAQKVYDDSAGGLVDDETLRTALKAQLAAATIMATGTASPSPDANQTLAAWQAAIAALAQAQQAVTDDVAKVANAAYTYVLLDPTATAGTVITGTNAANTTYVSIKIMVQGTTVVAGVCSSGSGATSGDPNTCAGGFDAVTINSVQGSTSPAGKYNMSIWTGTRSGTTATVALGTSNPYAWATIQFAGLQPQAAALKFVGASNCDRADGTRGYPAAAGGCQDTDPNAYVPPPVQGPTTPCPDGQSWHVIDAPPAEGQTAQQYWMCY